MRILKYPLDVRLGTPCAIKMPPSAVPISVGVDNSNTLCVWAEVDDGDVRRVNRSFLVVFTDEHFAPMDFRHIGTVLNGTLVLHIYYGG